MYRKKDERGSPVLPTGTGFRSALSTALLAVALVAAGSTNGLGATAAQAAARRAMADTVTIALTGDGATSSSDVGVTIDRSTVTITAAGTYRITGPLDDGQLVVNSEGAGAVALVLAGVAITSSTTAPLAVKAAEDVSVTLDDGTHNQLSDAATSQYPGGATDADAALFSAVDLTIRGTGALSVRGNANDGIGSLGTLTIESGTIDVTAVDRGVVGVAGVQVLDGAIVVHTNRGHGIAATNTTDFGLGSVTIRGGKISITAGMACVKAANMIAMVGGSQTLTCADNALDAGRSVSVSGGSVTVNRCYEGIESTVITVSGGSIAVTAMDDGFNAEMADSDEQPGKDQWISISGGTVVIYSIRDGLDSNGGMTITGGTVVIDGPARNNSSALSVDDRFVDSGGTLLAVGSVRAQGPLEQESQGFVVVKFAAPQDAGTIVHLTAEDGAELVAAKTSKTFQSVVYASPKLTPGKSYRVYTGGSVSGPSIGAMYPAGSIVGATQLATVTAQGSTTGVGAGAPRG